MKNPEELVPMDSPIFNMTDYLAAILDRYKAGAITRNQAVTLLLDFMADMGAAEEGRFGGDDGEIH
ncbi:hypothetical protein M977_04717 [Buttiauxella gaviniae ATCC 51604]|uniref:Uncharacterized protein n=1 Tax=Buttiauxella gaviniae ATCC 51604 TaxID=1354253 RepID=A0A1B7HIX4_9ENTR|nr:hypothetical protein [Buttiauxella gaviniae]OAT15580.1 hypothetical protein M977_04717 [Buttiauxella gaviniae ATCC 51604]